MSDFIPEGTRPTDPGQVVDSDHLLRTAIKILMAVRGDGEIPSPMPVLAQGLKIPPCDDVETTLVGSTNNIDTIVYRDGGEVVGTVTCTYHGGVPTNDDAILKRAILT